MSNLDKFFLTYALIYPNYSLVHVFWKICMQEVSFAGTLAFQFRCLLGELLFSWRIFYWPYGEDFDKCDQNPGITDCQNY